MRLPLKKCIVCLFIIYASIELSLGDDIKTDFQKKIETSSQAFLKEPYFKKAQFFYFQEEWDSTLVYTTKQLGNVDLDPELYNYCYLFRAISFKKKEMFNESKKALDRISKSFAFYSHVKFQQGIILWNLKKFHEALSYFKEIEHVEEEGMIDKVDVLNNIGLCYLALKNYDQAEPYLIQNVKYREAQQDTLVLIECYTNLATLYYDQYKDAQAIHYFKSAFDLSHHIQDYTLKSKTASNMAVVEENRNNFAKALLYRKEHEQWQDSVYNENRIYETAQLEKQIVVAQKQQEVNVLQAEKRVGIAQRNGLLFSSAFLLVLLGFVYYFFREKVKTNRVIASQKEQLDELNTTKDKLFSIVSHDLRSSVNAIKVSNLQLEKSLKTDNKEQLHQLLKENITIANEAYGLLDNLLVWALLQIKQVFFQMTVLNLYHLTEQVAYNYQSLMRQKNIVFTSTVHKKDKIYADQESLKIMLRNLLDNAIKFTGHDGSIKIYTEEKEHDYVTLVVEDTGVGMDNATRDELLATKQLLSKKKNENDIGTGLGLHLVKSMVQKNQGLFAIESTLGKGTKIKISFLKNHLNESNTSTIG